VANILKDHLREERPGFTSSQGGTEGTLCGKSKAGSTSVAEEDVINGREKKLKRTIQEAIDRYDPKIVFIFASCSSGIIGDDIDAVAEDLQEKYEKAILIPIHCEGFKSKIHSTGFIVVFNAIQNYVIGDYHPENFIIEQVNLVNRLKPDFFIGIGEWVNKLPGLIILEAEQDVLVRIPMKKRLYLGENNV
jgi:nitrogenase molybdenum-iron protein alpha/beta subunit